MRMIANVITKLIFLTWIQIFGFCLGVNVELFENFQRLGATDAKNGSQGDDDVFVVWEDDSGDANHGWKLEMEESTLALFVAGVVWANDHDGGGAFFLASFFGHAASDDATELTHCFD